MSRHANRDLNRFNQSVSIFLQTQITSVIFFFVFMCWLEHEIVDVTHKCDLACDIGMDGCASV